MDFFLPRSRRDVDDDAIVEGSSAESRRSATVMREPLFLLLSSRRRRRRKPHGFWSQQQHDDLDISSILIILLSVALHETLLQLSNATINQPRHLSLNGLKMKIECRFCFHSPKLAQPRTAHKSERRNLKLQPLAKCSKRNVI